MPASHSSLVSPISQTPTPGTEKKQFLWQRPILTRNAHSSTSTAHRVTFSGSSKGSINENDKEKENGYSSASQSGSSRPPSPGQNNTPNNEISSSSTEAPKRAWQKVSRQEVEASWEPPGIAPGSPSTPIAPTSSKPFLVYSSSFLSLLGKNPSIRTLIEDTRVPYFHNSGIFLSRTSTLFFSSALHSDSSPSAAPSRNLATTITKVDLYSQGEFSRDKVRTPEHTYMPQSGCAWKKGIVLCAQGTFSEPAALIYMDAKKPHKTYPILTNYAGERLNSPHSCVAHSDGSLWFTDPHLGYYGINGNQGFRPRPKLPPMLYRFDLEAGDLRPMASDLTCPTSLAFYPEHRILYVLDQPSPAIARPHNSTGSGSSSGHPSPTFPQPLVPTPAQVFAYSIIPVGPDASPFLTSKRLFCIPMNDPTSLATDLFGNVYVGCSNGVQVYNVGGTCVGRVVTDGPVTGLCFGRGGELWVSLGTKLAAVRFGKDIRAGALGL